MSNLNIGKAVLKRGDMINISKSVTGGLKNLRVGLGWDAQEVPGGPDFDADVILFLMDNTKVCKGENVFYYNNLVSSDGEQKQNSKGEMEVVRPGYITHNGDNRNGEGEGDDETIDIKLLGIPDSITMGMIAVSIHDYDVRGQTFGNVDNAFVRLVDKDTNSEIAKLNLTFSACSDTAIIFGGLLKHEGQWFFKAPDQVEGVKNGIVGLLNKYGLGAQ